MVSKTVALTVLWTLGYWLCFGITYGYNAYFWDNSVAHNLMFSVVCWWLFGLWVIALLILISAITNSNTGVLTVTGGVVLASYLLGFLPKLKEYVPTMLADGNTLIYGTAGTENYMVSLAVTVVVSIVCFVISIPIFNRKQL